MKTNGKYQQLLNEADDFYALALKEYGKGKRKHDDKAIRQAAEKAWCATVQATMALGVKTTGKIPRSYNAQEIFLYNLKKDNTNGSIRENFLYNAYKNFAKGLHGNCFYHGDYQLADLDHDIEEVAKYIKEIKKTIR